MDSESDGQIISYIQTQAHTRIRSLRVVKIYIEKVTARDWNPNTSQWKKEPHSGSQKQPLPPPHFILETDNLIFMDKVDDNNDISYKRLFYRIIDNDGIWETQTTN